MTDAGKDGLVAGLATSSLVWAPYLAEINQLLTLITLVLGIVIALSRIRRLFVRMRAWWWRRGIRKE